MQSPHIRPATIADVPSICAMERSAAGAAHWPDSEYERLVQNGILLVAEQAGEIRGFVCAKTILDEAQLENIAVAASWRRSGVGDELIKALIDHCAGQTISKIFLEVRESNRAARGLYEKHGFGRVSQRRAYYSQPMEDAVLYEFRVPSADNSATQRGASNP